MFSKKGLKCKKCSIRLSPAATAYPPLCARRRWNQYCSGSSSSRSRWCKNAARALYRRILGEIWRFSLLSSTATSSPLPSCFAHLLWRPVSSPPAPAPAPPDPACRGYRRRATPLTQGDGDPGPPPPSRHLLCLLLPCLLHDGELEEGFRRWCGGRGMSPS
jgi:hypothetical protein